MGNMLGSKPFVLLLWFTVQQCMTVCFAISHFSSGDESALLAFKARVLAHDPHNVLMKNWSEGTSFCNWAGVTCSRRHQFRVTGLNLSYKGLRGTIGREIGNLTFLVFLDLGNNSFQGRIPDEIGHLRRLRFLHLDSNVLSGPIPESFVFLHKLRVLDLASNSLSGSVTSTSIFNLSSLITIDLSDNNFDGNLPEDMCGNLPKLEVLYLSRNQFGGQIPSNLQKCRQLKVLSLKNNFLTGSIPEQIGNFSNLQELYLDFNNLTGSLPLTIFNASSLLQIGISFNDITGSLPEDPCSKLQKLERLYLSRNQLRGQISPSFSSCRKMESLYLYGNKLTGILPREMGNISTLKNLSLHSNYLTGYIPSEIGNLLNLEYLRIDNNHLFGTIPSSIGNLSNLDIIALNKNYFHGNIPAELGQLSNLKWLDLSINNLTGEVPQSIFNISALEVIIFAVNSLSGNLSDLMASSARSNLKGLYFGTNFFRGPIPSSILNASKLFDIDLGDNFLSGNIPMTLGSIRQLQYLVLQVNQLTNDPRMSELGFLTSLVNCTGLQIFSLNSNPLNGTLPKSIGNLSTVLQQLDFGYCGIKGVTPEEIGNLSELIFLNLEGNELIGSIPESFGNLRKMQDLRIGRNKIQGSIPDCFCQMKALYLLNLRANNLSGPMPWCLGHLLSLRELYLHSNALNSSIPLSFWSNKDILTLDLSSNLLSGPLAPEIGNIKSIVSMDLSNNRFSGFIPVTVGQLQDLATVRLSKNMLQGPIPKSFVNLISLEILDLSENNLSGIIPESLEKLKHLVYFNVSLNQLSGEIPDGGPFENFTAESFTSNNALCGAVRFKVQACENQEAQHPSKTRVRRYSLPSIFSFLIAVTFIAWFLRSRGKSTQLPDSSNLPLGLRHRWISYYELLKATNNFDEGNLIGRGGLGLVYKAMFSGGMVAAVKVFNVELQDAFKSFEVECNVMRKIRHRNLVKVISSCSNLDFKALVLEYMTNGNLERWLYSHNYCLPMIQRLRIMIDVASALEYLHHGYAFPVVHCDLKPCNILLNENMTAHIADFGISKLLTEAQLMAHTKTLGTVRYMAPEYGSTGLVSTASDVYSYGILLMETFTRKKPTDEMFSGESTLRRWISGSLPDAVKNIIDANLFTIDGEILNSHLSSLTAIMGLALECTADLPELRINVKDALVKLKKIESQFHQNVVRGRQVLAQ